MLARNLVLRNRYRIVGPLGAGGMATVYEALDQHVDDHRVAIKHSRLDSPDMRRAFKREAKLLYAARHPALPVVIDYFSEEAGDFLVMDYVEGEDLGAQLARRNAPFEVADVLAWADRL